MSRPMFTALLAAAFLVLLPPAAPAAPGAAPASSSAWAEPGEVLDDDAYESWTRVRRGLAQGFDDVCGDTFCEGDYTNIQSLRFLCSVHRGNGAIGACSWSFAASDESIGSRGTVTSQQVGWQCLLPLAPRTTMAAFLAALDVEEPIDAVIPGTGATAYDALVDCL